MKTQKFAGATSREVLMKVKQALGDDAIILSNCAIGERIEVLAVAAAELPGNETSADAPAHRGCAPRNPELDELRSEIERVKLTLERDMATRTGAQSGRAAAGRNAVMRELLNA